MGYLVLVRHGESLWNQSNKFTGWIDVPLSSQGIQDAQNTALSIQNIQFHAAYSSQLVRAQQTLLIILAQQKACAIIQHDKGALKIRGAARVHQKKELPVYFKEALNERYYGALQGMNKDSARKTYGKEQVFLWRRSYDIAPPEGESLKDVTKRTVPFYQKEIVPRLQQGQNVIIAAHGNSLRAIIKHIEQISDTEIPHLELSLGKPLMYKFTKKTITKLHTDHQFTRPVLWK